MKKYLFILPLLVFLLGACGDDDDIKTPKGERNWLILEDSDDPLDHQRYEIFRDFGVPVYYNDTIGSEQRTSLSGPYTYYERLQVFYNPGYPPLLEARFTLLKNRMDAKDMLDYLQSDMLPRMEKFYIPSILLVDSLIIPSSDSTVYKGLNTITIGKVKEFTTMDDVDKKWFIGGVMRALVISSFMSDNARWLEDEFFAKTLAVTNGVEGLTRSPYNDSEPGNTYVQQVLSLVYPGQPEKYLLGNLGFLNIKLTYLMGNEERYAKLPSREGDVGRFMEAILALTEEEFTERWGQYPVVMEKYEVMKEKMAEYGLLDE